MFPFRRKSSRKFDQALVLEKPEETVPVSAPAPRPVSEALPETDPLLSKRRRPVNANKTRLMGFDTSDGRVAELFSGDQAQEDSARVQYAVATIMITKGPGFGECFSIKSGMSQIGRSDGQAIQLDYGDMAISRENHAAIVYDPKDHSFLLGHGGKSNIVRLNGKPVVSTNDLKNGDEIEIGETRLRFVALCSEEFNWETAQTDEGTDDDDVEIA